MLLLYYYYYWGGGVPEFIPEFFLTIRWVICSIWALSVGEKKKKKKKGKKGRKKGLDSKWKVFESWIETFVRTILSGASYKQVRAVLHGAKELELCVPNFVLCGHCTFKSYLLFWFWSVACMAQVLHLYIAYQFWARKPVCMIWDKFLC